MASRNEPTWLPLELAIKANAREVARTGEPHQIINQANLEGALGRVQSMWHYGQDDLVVLAATMFDGLAQAHPFIQGNKRTAWACTVLFLKANGHTVDQAFDGDGLIDFLTRVAAGTVPADQFQDVMGRMVKPI